MRNGTRIAFTRCHCQPAHLCNRYNFGCNHFDIVGSRLPLVSPATDACSLQAIPGAQGWKRIASAWPWRWYDGDIFGCTGGCRDGLPGRFRPSQSALMGTIDLDGPGWVWLAGTNLDNTDGPGCESRSVLDGEMVCYVRYIGQPTQRVSDWLAFPSK